MMAQDIEVDERRVLQLHPPSPNVHGGRRAQRLRIQVILTPAFSVEKSGIEIAPSTRCPASVRRPNWKSTLNSKLARGLPLRTDTEACIREAGRPGNRISGEEEEKKEEKEEETEENEEKEKDREPG
eukprot:GHVU01034906.1.p1 GENE.GHVU01034906.1~~GHVU01034906.1.p1  ORF type:complete len:127 (-),score=29.50 GHVU01034906.1:1101-1481(-)